MKATVTEVLLINKGDSNFASIMIVYGYDKDGLYRCWKIESYKIARALDALRRHAEKKTKIEVKEG